jgi:predicted nuclease of predicted toxin-antitoxin system
LKVLLDSCVWGGVRKALSDAGHDVVWAGDWKTDPGDEEILHRAHQETRVLVTLDKDFGELAIVRGLPHSGLVRARMSIVVLAKYGPELEAGAIITVEAARVRVRPPTDSA